MFKRLILGALMASLVVIAPALGNPNILASAHLWILLGLGVSASVLQPAYNPLAILFSSGDRGTGAQIIWSVYLVQLAATLEAAYLRYPHSVAWDAAALIALSGCVVGLAIRTWAVLTLGPLFTMHISIEKDHQVIRNGPYAFVRHPSYLGAFVLYLSAAAFLHAWYATLAALIVLPLAFLRRIGVEEERLRAEFGLDYEIYAMKSKKIIPFVW